MDAATPEDELTRRDGFDLFFEMLMEFVFEVICFLVLGL